MRVELTGCCMPPGAMPMPRASPAHVLGQRWLHPPPANAGATVRAPRAATLRSGKTGHAHFSCSNRDLCRVRSMLALTFLGRQRRTRPASSPVLRPLRDAGRAVGTGRLLRRNRTRTFLPAPAAPGCVWLAISDRATRAGHLQTPVAGHTRRQRPHVHTGAATGSTPPLSGLLPVGVSAPRLDGGGVAEWRACSRPTAPT